MFGDIDGLDSTFITGNTINTGAAIDDDARTLYINHVGYNGGQTRFRNFEVRDGKGAAAFVVTGSTKAAQFAGNVGIGRAPSTNVELDVYAAAQDSNVYIESLANTAQIYLRANQGGSATGDAEDCRLQFASSNTKMHSFVLDGSTTRMYFMQGGNTTTVPTGATGDWVFFDHDGTAEVSIIGGNGFDAILNLFADDGDDNADRWQIKAQATGNPFHIGQWNGLIYNTLFQIASSSGEVTIPDLAGVGNRAVMADSNGKLYCA